MIYIVSGPTCSGKNTFLKSTKIDSITNLSSTHPIVFPATMPNGIDLEAGCFFHYNILRPSDQCYRNRDTRIQSLYDFTSDYPWLELSKLSVPKKAIVLIVSRTTLEKRISSRRHIELINLTGKLPAKYPVRHWLGVLNTVDLYELYLNWFAELKSHGIKYTLINSETRNYEIMRQDQLKYFINT